MNIYQFFNIYKIYIMAKFRWFSTKSDTAFIDTGSDHTNNIRNQTIYSSIIDHCNNKFPFHGAKEVIYNGPVIKASNGCLVQALSHADLLKLTKGAYLCDALNYDISAARCAYNFHDDGNFMITDYSNNNIVYSDFSLSLTEGSYNKIHPGPFEYYADTCGNYPGVWIDPCNNILYHPCDDGNNFMPNVDICKSKVSSLFIILVISFS